MPDGRSRPLPETLEVLEELALDLRLTGSQLASRIWRKLDAEAWERISNPYVLLQNVENSRLDAIAQDAEFQAELREWLARRRRYLETPGWFRREHPSAKLGTVAYFSMEFGLGEALPIYSGGLGILAGDHLKSASDLDVPLVGVGLLYQQGYFRQMLGADGGQREAFPFNDPGTLPISPVLDDDGRWPRVELELPGRSLFLRVWSAQVGRVKLYLLDSNHPMNNPWDRGITTTLYAAGREKRLLQELVLGVGGWRLLEELEIPVDVCHLNEGHAAFAILARAAAFARREGVSIPVALRATRAGNVFTTHTPVDAAFDKFEPVLLIKYARPFTAATGTDLRDLLAMGRKNPDDDREPFNMAYLAMRGCCHVNGVSRLHGRVSRRLFEDLFPGWPEAEVPVAHVTNGVHMPTWDSVPSNNLWQQAYGGPDRWIDHLDDAAQAIARVSHERLWVFRAHARQLLVDYVRRRLARQVSERGGSAADIRAARHVLDPNALTLGFARRFTEYKRPNLVLFDEDRFSRILTDAERPVQFLVAGKAHPNDEHGKSMIRGMAHFATRPELRERVVFLEDYDLTLAQHFAAGIDVWVNTPRRPAEACGTSGMKMIVNGGLHLSVRDGWWDEAFHPDLGWAVGGGDDHGRQLDRFDAEHFYELLEQRVIPEFYDRDEQGLPGNWLNRVQASMSRLAPTFSSNRMVREYVERTYLPAAAAYRNRAANRAALAQRIERWHAEILENWHGLRFGGLQVRREEESWCFEVEVFLGDLARELVEVQLYAEPPKDEPPKPVAMQFEAAIPGAVNGFRYVAVAPVDRPAEHYTPRVVPHHAESFVPQENTHITWRG